MARSHGGQFILRIEDTDQARLVPGSVEAIYESLKWLGIEWDEGPDVGGPFGPYVQSHRLDLYRGAAARLIGLGRAYRCFCTPERLTQMRAEQTAAGRPTGYDGLCSAIPRDVAEDRATREPSVVRFAMDRQGTIVLEDLVRGTVTFENRLQEDFVILKSDGFPTYHLALVVDDHAMEITHAIRGDEWISSSPKHLQLYDALGYEPTLFAHLPLILGPDHKKLSKRTGDTSLLDYRKEGYLPEAMVNFLALLGWSLDDKTTIIRPSQLATQFTIERVVANPAVFDIEKLRYLNGQYMRDLGDAEWAQLVRERCEADLPQSIRRPLSTVLLDGAAPLLKERVGRLTEIAPMVEFLFIDGDIQYPPSLLTDALKGDWQRVEEVLEAVHSSLSGIPGGQWQADAVELAIRGLEEQLAAKLRKWIPLVYAAVMGRTQGIPLFGSLVLLGRERSLGRLVTALNVARNAAAQAGGEPATKPL